MLCCRKDKYIKPQSVRFLRHLLEVMLCYLNLSTLCQRVEKKMTTTHRSISTYHCDSLRSIHLLLWHVKVNPPPSSRSNHTTIRHSSLSFSTAAASSLRRCGYFSSPKIKCPFQFQFSGLFSVNSQPPRLVLSQYFPNTIPRFYFFATPTNIATGRSELV